MTGFKVASFGSAMKASALIMDADIQNPHGYGFSGGMRVIGGDIVADTATVNNLTASNIVADNSLTGKAFCRIPQRTVVADDSETQELYSNSTHASTIYTSYSPTGIKFRVNCLSNSIPKIQAQLKVDSAGVYTAYAKLYVNNIPTSAEASLNSTTPTWVTFPSMALNADDEVEVYLKSSHQGFRVRIEGFKIFGHFEINQNVPPWITDLSA